MFKRRKNIRIKSGNNAERARFYSPPLLYNVFMFQCARGYARVDAKLVRTSADVLSEAKALNAVKGQKVAGSSPVRPSATGQSRLIGRTRRSKLYGCQGLEPIWVWGRAALNQLAQDKENAGCRIFEAVDSNPFGLKSGPAHYRFSSWFVQLLESVRWSIRNQQILGFKYTFHFRRP
jgi:hypothetical protein